MPWSTRAEAREHVAGLSDHQADVWLSAANGALAECLDDGGDADACDGRAIRIANAAAQDAPREAPQKRGAMRELKTVRLEQFKVMAGDEGGDAGRFAGYGSVFNAVDLVGDTVLPGAYTETLPKFVRDGFIAWGHDWDNPIATIDAAREDERGLWLEASFHSHPEAQRVRTLAQERLQRGKTMGLSIGFQARDWKTRSDGVRELLAIELMETSLVTFPAEPNAQVTAVKAASFAGFAAAAVALERELKEGRMLSSRNVETLRSVAEALSTLQTTISALLEAGEPRKRDEDDDEKRAAAPAEVVRAWAELQRTLVRLQGARV
jgi:uncharacterized protein